MALELYHWEPGPNCAELLVCLNEKGLAFESHYVDLIAFEQHSPEFLLLNPRGEVPVLVHDGHVLTETTLILEYLDAAFAGISLVPADRIERYRMRVWTKYANDYFAPSLTLLGWHVRMAPKMKSRDLRAALAGLVRLPPDRQAVWRLALADSYSDEELTRSRQHLEVASGRMEDALTKMEWLAGSSYSLADIALFPLAKSLRSLCPELLSAAHQPKLVQWIHRMEERPAARAAWGLAREACPEDLFAPGPELGRWG